MVVLDDSLAVDEVDDGILDRDEAVRRFLKEVSDRMKGSKACQKNTHKKKCIHKNFYKKKL